MNLCALGSLHQKGAAIYTDRYIYVYLRGATIWQSDCRQWPYK